MPIAVACVMGYIVLNYPHYRFFFDEGNYQSRIADRIAQKIAGTVDDSYVLVSTPLTSTNDHIRYYLEIKGERPESPEYTGPVDYVIILCYEAGGKCNVMDEPQYQVVIFGDKKIGDVIEDPEVTIYKMIHAK